MHIYKVLFGAIICISGLGLACSSNGSDNSSDDAGPDGSTDDDVDTNAALTLLWAARAGGDDETFPRKVAITEDGSVAVVGYYAGRTTFGEGEKAVSLENDSLTSMFLAKYDSKGKFAWAQTNDSSDNTSMADVAIGKDDSIYLTGGFRGTTILGKGENSIALTSSTPDGYDIIIARYTSAGILDWAIRAGGPYGNSGEGIVVLPDGSILIAGFFGHEITFGNGDNTVTLSVDNEDSPVDQGLFLARYLSDGTLAWAKTIVSSASIPGLKFRAMDLGQENSIVVTGTFSQLTIFGNGEKSTTFEQYGDSTPFLAKYDLSGQLIWVENIHTENNKRDHIVHSVVAFPDGSTYITGNVDGTIAPDEYNYDISVSRYDSNGKLFWRERAGRNEDSNYGTDICALPNGTAIVTGGFETTAIFGEEKNEIELFAGNETYYYNSDIFIANYDTDGTLIWAHDMGSHYAADVGNCIAAFPDGSFIIAGYFGDTLQLGNDSNSISLTASGEQSVFLARYSIE